MIWRSGSVGALVLNERQAMSRGRSVDTLLRRSGVEPPGLAPLFRSRLWKFKNGDQARSVYTSRQRSNTCDSSHYRRSKESFPNTVTQFLRQRQRKRQVYCSKAVETLTLDSHHLIVTTPLQPHILLPQSH